MTLSAPTTTGTTAHHWENYSYYYSCYSYYYSYYYWHCYCHYYTYLLPSGGSYYRS